MNFKNEEVKEEYLNSAVEECKKSKVLFPTFKQLSDPSLIPEEIKQKLKSVNMQDVNPLNLFRISWYNEPIEQGGLFKDIPNYIEIPPEISGICRLM